MPTEFALSVVAPDRSIVEETVTAVTAPGIEGYFGVLYGHAPTVAALKPGLVEYVDRTGNRHYVYVGGGFAEVSADRVTVLADEGARATEIDVVRAEAALEEARRALRGDDGARVDEEEAVLEVDRAIARLKAAKIGR